MHKFLFILRKSCFVLFLLCSVAVLMPLLGTALEQTDMTAVPDAAKEQLEKIAAEYAAQEKRAEKRIWDFDIYLAELAGDTEAEVLNKPTPGPACTLLMDVTAYHWPDNAGSSTDLSAGSEGYLLGAYLNGGLNHCIQIDKSIYYVSSAAVDLADSGENYVFHPDQDMRTRTNYTGEQLEACLSNGLSGLGSAFAAAEKTYGVNALFLIAICQLESGSGTSSLAQTQNNLIGLRSGDGWASFSSKEECINYLGEYLSGNYLTPGQSLYHGSTIAGVSVRYCNSSQHWINLCSSFMRQNIEKITEISASTPLAE